MNNWLRQHAFAFGSALNLLRKGFGNFLFNVLVLSATLALPFAGLTVLDNVQSISSQFAVDPEISVFMGLDTPREKAAALEPAIRRIVQAESRNVDISFISREKALESLNQKSGISDVIATLGVNPLPDGYLIRIGRNEGNTVTFARIEDIGKQLEKLPNVQKVQIDSAWIKRLAALLRVLQSALIFLAGTLGLVVIAVTFNTIRLQVLTRVDEIAISRLVGATRSFIRRPFYYMGALLGLAAGTVALGMVALALLPFNAAIADLARLYSSELQFAPLSVLPSILMLLISAALGWIGAVLSVNRHLRLIG
jgi:cell division transport system permease protein